MGTMRSRSRRLTAPVPAGDAARVIELRAPGGLARAVVLPEHGGRLHQLWVTAGGRDEQLLWSPDDPSDYAGRPTRGGCFPMAPWVNRIRDGRFTWEGREYHVPTDGKPHAIHGRVLQRAWEVREVSSESCELACPLDDGWPWAGSAGIGYELADRALTLRLGIRSDERFPFGLGWHPWFRREAFGSDVRVTVPARERYEVVGNLPTGRLLTPGGEYDLAAGPQLGDRRLDDCYRGLAGPVRIVGERLQLSMELSGAEPHVQVFTPEDAVCVEPQTSAPDAFNLAEAGIGGTGIAVLDGAAVFTTTWRWN